MKRHYPTPTHFRPQNFSKYVGDIRNITMRSSWEARFASWCDSNPAVLRWGSEIRAIPYYSQVDKRMRNYFPDFWILVQEKDGNEKKFVVEIKPKSQMEKPQYTRRKNRLKFLEEAITFQRNQDKWTAAKKFADKHGFTFIVINEDDLRNKIRGERYDTF